jgi:hypothetical protein
MKKVSNILNTGIKNFSSAVGRFKPSSIGLDEKFSLLKYAQLKG